MLDLYVGPFCRPRIDFEVGSLRTVELTVCLAVIPDRKQVEALGWAFVRAGETTDHIEQSPPRSGP